MDRARVLAWGLPLGFAAAAAAYLLVGLQARLSASFGWLVLGAALIGSLLVAVERMFSALTHRTADEPSQLGATKRHQLEREKTLTLRSLKELEFDFRMGKLSEGDYAQIAAALRQRVLRLMHEIDESPQVEKSLPPNTKAHPICASCKTPNDNDAAFCKRCGTRLGNPA